MEPSIEQVFPAYAGMSRGSAHNAAFSHGFPRLRGDEPLLAAIPAPAPTFSPPTRG